MPHHLAKLVNTITKSSSSFLVISDKFEDLIECSHVRRQFFEHFVGIDQLTFFNHEPQATKYLRPNLDRYDLPYCDKRRGVNYEVLRGLDQWPYGHNYSPALLPNVLSSP